MIKKKSLLSIPLNLAILIVLLFLYAISDMQNSTVTYNVNTDRSSVYFYLIAIICFLFINVFLYVAREKFVIKITPIFTSLFFNTVWIFLVDFLQNAQMWTTLTHLGLCVLWILGYMFFQYLFEYRYNSIQAIGSGFFAVFILYAVAILYYFYDVQIRKGSIPVLNIIYNVIVVVPWLLVLFKDDSGRKKMVIVISIIAAALSLKRGGLIALPVMLIGYLLLEAKRQNKLKSAIKTIVILAIVLGLAIFAINSMTDGFLLERFSTDELEGGSGRTDIYAAAIANINSRGIKDLIFGLGSGSSPQIIGTGCHNEWLEFTFSFGIVGALLYFILIYRLFSTVRRIKNTNPEFYAAGMMMFLYVLIVGMIGGIYFVHSSFFVFSFFGAAEGYLNGRNKWEQENNIQ